MNEEVKEEVNRRSATIQLKRDEITPCSNIATINPNVRINEKTLFQVDSFVV